MRRFLFANDRVGRNERTVVFIRNKFNGVSVKVIRVIIKIRTHVEIHNKEKRIQLSI